MSGPSIRDIYRLRFSLSSPHYSSWQEGLVRKNPFSPYGLFRESPPTPLFTSILWSLSHPEPSWYYLSLFPLVVRLRLPLLLFMDVACCPFPSFFF